jgi:Recombination endonuclease VII
VRRKERYARDAAYRARESARRRAYHRAHKYEISVRRQGGHLKRRYGISRADYAALLARQGGVCAICGKPPEKTLCVDHCHSTGRIRGLLCRKCNFGLGCYGEDQAALIAALAYLGRGAFDRGGAGSAARHALLARAALPPTQ